jgi:serine/threonine-protein kinase HipA
LATLAGIKSAQARVVTVQNQSIAMIRRFDRTTENNRIPYMSGATLLQANRDEEHSYTELIDVMRSHCQDFGFLYVANNQWYLAPAFDWSTCSAAIQLIFSPSNPSRS